MRDVSLGVAENDPIATIFVLYTKERMKTTGLEEWCKYEKMGVFLWVGGGGGLSCNCKL